MDGQVRRYFSDSCDNAVDEEGHDDVSDQDECWTTSSQCLT